MHTVRHISLAETIPFQNAPNLRDKYRFITIDTSRTFILANM